MLLFVALLIKCPRWSLLCLLTLPLESLLRQLPLWGPLNLWNLVPASTALSAPLPSVGTSSVSSAGLRDSLAAGFPPCPADFLSQAGKLGGSSLSAADRVRRAWTAGCWAKAVAENQISTPNRSVQLDLRPRFYAVLRAEDSSGPFLCLSATTYWRLVGRIQENDSISHAFPSELEAKVYFAGASAPDYQKLQ